jgi:hypothetical protein
MELGGVGAREFVDISLAGVSAEEAGICGGQAGAGSFIAA